MDDKDANPGTEYGKNTGQSRVGPFDLPKLSCSDFESQNYSMNHKKRGKAVIISNENFVFDKLPKREGTEKDLQSMITVLRDSLGFDALDIDEKRDVTAHEIEKHLKKIAKEDHTDEDCFVCVVLSHGDEGYICGTDERLSTSKLVAPFKNNVCPSLAGKPKVFFIQACTKEMDVGVEDDKAESSPQYATKIIPAEADVLIATSIVPGTLAWKHNQACSWFVQAIADIFIQNARAMDLFRMLTRVNRRVAQKFHEKAQRELVLRSNRVSYVTSLLTKELYFP